MALNLLQAGRFTRPQDQRRAGQTEIALQGAAQVVAAVIVHPGKLDKHDVGPALRMLAQSMARELHPAGIHIAHVVIDGGIRSAMRPDSGDNMLDPEAIAASYLHLIDQPRSSWSWEIEVRPWVEKF